MDNDPAFASRAQSKAKGIFNALKQGSYHPTLWPRSLPECLAIAAFLNALNEQSADQHLLEMSEAELAIIECVCIEKGIGYDELIAEAVMDLYRKGDLQEQDVKDEDPADWWKNA
jgi:hypothetical protein